MKLVDVVTAYITLQQSLGLRFQSGGRLLRRFARLMGDIPIDAVRPESVAAFLQGAGALSTSWQLRHVILSGFYRFAISRGYVALSPLPVSRPQLPRSQSPYVYSTGELRRLIAATSVLYVGHSRLQSSMFRMLILLLYGSGLRIGEALGLTMADVDLGERVITVRQTKFFKTRLVPIGPRLTQELMAYSMQRRTLPLPMGEDSRFFTTRTGRGWPYSHVITLFQALRRAAGIECPVGELRPPRLHDLRHTAAVHRVIAWYRSDCDVQRLLPQLATYLGHVNLKSTQRYLQMTPELLEEASRRFAHYAQREGGDHE